jgi:predicted DNA-binding helix-hairpin-helix protein
MLHDVSRIYKTEHLFYNRGMDVEQKLKTIATQMYLESAEEVSLKRAPTQPTSTVAPCGVRIPTQRSQAQAESLGVSHAVMPGGKTIKLLKTMQTTACERNCHYCPFRAGRSFRRASFTPDELADSFMRMQRAGMVEGLFLSSGIIRGGVTTQDKMLDTVEILRHRRGFDGYIHLKIMPGAEKAQVERAMQLADRLSVNLEGPTIERLKQLAPMKQLVKELFTPLRWIEEIRQTQRPNRTWKGYWPSTATQFVVGAVGDTDVELLRTTDYLFRKTGLKRAYFSAFSPIRDTPLENQPAESPMREHRLYQASFLLRDYGFDMEDLPFVGAGMLPLDVDPKEGWARQHLAHAPVELNRASREDLLRVPGIGTKGADKIVWARRWNKLSDLHQLRQLGIATKRVAPYVLLDGRRAAQQMRLF